MSTISSNLPSLYPSYRSLSPQGAGEPELQKKSAFKDAARTATDIGVGAGMIGLTGLTILNSGAPSGFAQAGVPAIAYANIAAGIVYVIDQAVQNYKAYDHRDRYYPRLIDNARNVGSWLGMGAGASLFATGFSQAVGWPGGVVVGLSVIAAGLMAGKGIAQLKLQDDGSSKERR